MLTLNPMSHTDHVPPVVLGYVLGRFHDRSEFFIETIELPDFLPTVESRLYGPAAGDPPVAQGEAEWGFRKGREWPSRLTDLPPRQTRTLTVVAGPFNGQECVLFTVYGGPRAPREVDDPILDTKTPEERAEARAFWAQHALAK